jgi:SSS family transporter
MEEGLIPVFGTANWILAFVGVFLAVLVVLGLIYSKEVKVCDDLVVAGRKLNFFYVVSSILATWICAGAIMGSAGYAYLFGMQGVIWDPWAPALCMVLVALFFAYRLRKAKYLTVIDFFNSRYNKQTGFLFTITQIISGIVWMAAQLVALGIIVSLTTGFPLSLTVIIATAVIIIATTSGGLCALARADAIVVTLVVIGLLILFPTVMREAGGISHFIATAQNMYELPTWAMTPVASPHGYLWYTGIFAFLLYIAAWASLSLGDVQSQALLQRALAAKNEKTAVYGFLTSGILYLLIGLMPVTIGIAAFTIGLQVTEAQAEHILPFAAYTFLPDWAGVLLITAIAATIISTAGNTGLGSATLIGHNIYRYFKPGATSQDTLRVTRIATVVSILLAMIIGLYFERVYKLIIFSGGMMLPTIFAAFALGYFWKKANSIGAISSFITGWVAWLSAYFYLLNVHEILPIDAIFMSLVPGAIVSILTLVVVSLLTQKRHPAKPILSHEGQDMTNMPKFFWSKQA